MTIRPARKEDAPYVLELMMSAMGYSLYAETGATNKQQVRETLAYLFALEGNHLSYQNTLVDEIDHHIAGLVLFYHGSQEVQLLQTTHKQLSHLRGTSTRSLQPETEGDDFYISLLAVDPQYGGKGIGTALLKAVEAEALQQGYHKLSLLVALDNERAFRLYQRLGYQRVKDVKIDTYPYHYMVKKLTPAPATSASSPKNAERSPKKA